jgi:hypothetical protein
LTIQESGNTLTKSNNKLKEFNISKDNYISKLMKLLILTSNFLKCEIESQDYKILNLMQDNRYTECKKISKIDIQKLEMTMKMI